ncbi:MAG: hypothetical protein PHX21_06185 [bacterium]|nr:hypothetical protein [bacterium]
MDKSNIKNQKSNIKEEEKTGEIGRIRNRQGDAEMGGCGRWINQKSNIKEGE